MWWSVYYAYILQKNKENELFNTNEPDEDCRSQYELDCAAKRQEAKEVASCRVLHG